MKRIVLLLLILIPFCLANEQQVISADISFPNSSQSPEIKTLTLINGYPSDSSEGPYSVNLFDDLNNQLYLTNFNLSFYISGVPEELKEITKTFYLPYFEKNMTLVITKNGQVIFEKNVSVLLCNNNTKCETNENFASCPNDCASNSKDGYCNPTTDGVCDPDCYSGVDYDCYLEEVKQNELDKNQIKPVDNPTKPNLDKNIFSQKPQNTSFDLFSLIVPIGVLFLAGVAIGVFFLLMKKYK
jgi:hypothetical protein